MREVRYCEVAHFQFYTSPSGSTDQRIRKVLYKVFIFYIFILNFVTEMINTN